MTRGVNEYGFQENVINKFYVNKAYETKINELKKPTCSIMTFDKKNRSHSVVNF